MNKKVLIFSTAYLPFIGGAELATKEITDRLDDYQFFLITARMDKSLPKFEKIGRVEVHRLGFGSKLDKFLLVLLGLRFAKSLIKKNNITCIWSIMASQASVLAAWIKILNPKLKLLLTLQEGDEEDHLKRYVFGNELLYRLFIKPWHLFIFKNADVVQAISTDLKIRAIENLATCPIEVVPNAVDIKLFSKKYSTDKLTELKNKLKKKENDYFVITTSRLVKKNAVEDIVEALKYLPDNYKLLVLGDGPLKEDLKLKIKNLGLDARVAMIGLVDQKEIPKYLAISDVFCRPSLSEGLGNSFLEAMAAGVPVVATEVGGIPDFLFDPSVNKDKEPTGLFCEVINPESIAKQVLAFMHNDNLRERIVSNAREMVARKYDWEIIARDMRGILDEL